MEMSETRLQEIEPQAVETRLIDAIREHPWLSLLGAAALGFVAARIARGGR